MSSAAAAYLVMVVATFIVFSAVLAWQAHAQAVVDRAKAPQRPANAPPIGSGMIATH